MLAKPLLILAVLCRTAYADTPVLRPEAIEVDREAPPPGRAEFGFDGGAPVGAWAASAQLGFVDDPIVLRSGDRVKYPVAHRETLSLGAAYSVTDSGSLVVDARVPLAHQIGDRLVGLGDMQRLEHWVLGDLVLGARIRIASGERLQTFARFVATLPTGDDDNFAGEARWTYSTALVGRLALPGHVVIAATGGILLRGAEVQVGDRIVGDELVGGVGAAVGVPPIAGLWCVPEQLRITGELVGALGDKVGGQRGPSPAEARLGVIGRPLPELAIGVRAGLGLDDQIGSPRFRALLEVTFQAPPPARSPSHADEDEEVPDED